MSLEKHFLDSHLTLTSSVTSMGTLSPGYCRQDAAVPGRVEPKCAGGLPLGPQKRLFEGKIQQKTYRSHLLDKHRGHVVV